MTGKRSQRDAEETRRAFLIKLGMASSAIYAAPVLLRLSSARASGSFSGGSFSGGSFSGSAPRPAPPRPQIVVATPQPGDVDLIVDQGFTLLDREPLGIVDFELARMEVPAGVTIDAARAQIIGIVPDALFDLNHIYEPGELTCEDGECVAFDLIGWTANARSCLQGTTIGMIDTVVNAGHAALDGVNVEKLQTIGSNRTLASAPHGTAIAVLLAGRADTRTPGLLGGVQLIAAEAFHRSAAGEDVADSFDIARAIDRLVGSGVEIINMSFAGPANAVLEAVVAAAGERGVALVAAAGNAGPQSEPLYPAAYQDVVAVTAIDGDSRVYRRAVNGAHIDFAGPGVQLWTAASISGGRFRSGTSYAAPFVSAALAAGRAKTPEKTVRELVDDLAAGALDLGEEGRDDVFGWGLVQTPGDCG